MRRSMASFALVVLGLALPAMAPDEKVVSGTIGESDRNGMYIVLKSGAQLYAPLDLSGIVRTELKPGRPIKAYYRPVDGRNVVNLMFTLGVHPGGGG
jgi:hypothetical protein